MNGHALPVILTIAAVTVLLRALPYVAGDAIERSAYLRYLGRTMPVGVMALLVAFTFQATDPNRPPHGLPLVGFALLSGVLYWRTRGLLVSIGIPLAGYIAVMSLLFPEAA